ncbi:MAG: hypothetical protein LBQ83_07030 [Candidatus Margulisbacteria bacterium]|jgi:antitoxin component of MazEF toxin-antitoxin module|nr:hypothetical protein [Candidatus Margulisiibacteriota bacterium]
MYAKQIALNDIQEAFSQEIIGKRLYELIKNLISVQSVLNALDPVKTGTGQPEVRIARIEEAQQILSETRTLIAGEELKSIVRNNTAVLSTHVDSAAGYLDAFNASDTTIRLNEKKLTALENKLEKQKIQLAQDKRKDFQIQPQLYAGQALVELNIAAEKQAVADLSKNDFEALHINYPALQELSQSILPQEYNAENFYYLEITPELKAALHTENIQEYIHEIGGQEFFCAESPEAKAALGKKIRGLILSVYTAALETNISGSRSRLENNLLSASNAKNAVIKELSNQEFIKQAMLYTQLAVLEYDSASLFYNPAGSGRTARQWLARSEQSIKNAARSHPLKRALLLKENRNYYLKYARSNGLEEAVAQLLKKPGAPKQTPLPVQTRLLEDKTPAPDKAELPAALAELEAPEQVETAVQHALEAASLNPAAETFSTPEELLAGIQAAGSWQNLLAILSSENNAKLLYVPSAAYYPELLQKVRKTAAEQFAENFKGKKQDAEQEANARLKDGIRLAVLAGISAAYKRRRAVFGGLIFASVLGILVGLGFGWPTVSGVLKNIFTSEIPESRKETLPITESEFEGRPAGGTPLYDFSGNADDIGDF